MTTARLQAELAKIPAIGASEFKKLSAAVLREWAKAEKAAEQASAKVGR